MDQNQAIDLLDSLVSRQQLTRQEHDDAKVAVQLLRAVSAEFSAMVLAKRKAEAEPKKPLDTDQKALS